MRAHLLQHVPFEGLGSIEPWLQANGAEVTATRFFANPDLPNPRDVDLLIVMGGPMSVNDERDFPWLATEKRFVREVIEADKAVVGVCLGAQLIASALGAPVYPNPGKEIGWFPISAVDPPSGRLCFLFPPEALVFHWHGETFDLPSSAARLARSTGCENQAFQLGQRVIGLQFHLETTPESARGLVEHCRSDLAPARYVQLEEEILATPAPVYRAANSLMGAVLQFVTGNGEDQAPGDAA